ncbi:hypothetical protein KSP39_PZI009918 [Platanthera zijinensis]|uniref:Uncharacterized protein n=1 Tax=Platanthera zijinensis TaxID=2320716 RepID=A0AAP0G750_9ASPA
MRGHQFPTSSKRSDCIVEFCFTSQENLRTSKPQQHVNLLTWDDTKIQPFPCKHSSPEACFENSLWKSGIFKEKGETLLPDFDIPAPAIEFRDEFDTTEVEFFHTDSHFNSAFDRKSLHEFYNPRNSTSTWNSNAEIDRIKSHDAFQGDYILPNTCKFERCLREEALVPYINESSLGLCIAFPLLERDAAGHNCFVPEEVDHFPTFLHDIFGFQDEIGRPSSGDVYRRGLSSLQSCSFDIMLRGLTRRMKLDAESYPSPTLVPGSSMYSDFRLSTARQSGCENDIDFVGAPNDFPINITILGRDEDFEFFDDRLSY